MITKECVQEIVGHPEPYPVRNSSCLHLPNPPPEVEKCEGPCNVFNWKYADWSLVILFYMNFLYNFLLSMLCVLSVSYYIFPCILFFQFYFDFTDFICSKFTAIFRHFDFSFFIDRVFKHPKLFHF